MDHDVIGKAAEFISEKGFGCVLALIDADGYPTASTYSVSKNDSIKWVTFCTLLSGNAPNRIKKCDRASICLNSSEEPFYNITLVGKIEVITDPEVKKEMWYESSEWGGPEDPNFCVLKFTTERYNLYVDEKEAVGKV